MNVDGPVPGGGDEDAGAAEQHGRHVAAVLQQRVVLMNLARSEVGVSSRDIDVHQYSHYLEKAPTRAFFTKHLCEHVSTNIRHYTLIL